MKAVRLIIAAFMLYLTWLPGLVAHAAAIDAPPAAGISVPVSVSSGGIFDSLRSVFGATPPQPNLIPPEEAFQISVSARDRNTLVAILTAANDYYLYRDRIQFSIQDTSAAAITDVVLPRGELKDDPTFGHVEVYYGKTEVLIGLNQTTSNAWASLNLRASFQGCNDPTGVCYPPMEETLTVSLADAAALDGAVGPAVQQHADAGNDVLTRKAADRPVSETSLVRDLFAQEDTWALLAAFFGFGLVLAFTPCMLPMIPILSGLIVGQGGELSRRHAFGLSAVYVLAMATTYALAGVAAGLAGTMLGNPPIFNGAQK